MGHDERYEAMGHSLYVQIGLSAVLLAVGVSCLAQERQNGTGHGNHEMRARVAEPIPTPPANNGGPQPLSLADLSAGCCGTGADVPQSIAKSNGARLFKD